MKKSKRFDPKDRKMLLLGCAMSAARRKNYAEISRTDVAEVASCSPALVSHYLGDTSNIRKSIMRFAIEQEDAHIVAQGLVRNDPIAKRAPEDLKQAAINTLK